MGLDVCPRSRQRGASAAAPLAHPYSLDGGGPVCWPPEKKQKMTDGRPEADAAEDTEEGVLADAE